MDCDQRKVNNEVVHSELGLGVFTKRSFPNFFIPYKFFHYKWHPLSLLIQPFTLVIFIRSLELGGNAVKPLSCTIIITIVVVNIIINHSSFNPYQPVLKQAVGASPRVHIGLDETQWLPWCETLADIGGWCSCLAWSVGLIPHVRHPFLPLLLRGRHGGLSLRTCTFCIWR